MSDPAIFIRKFGPSAVALVLTLATGCEALLPKATPPPSFYALESVPVDARRARDGPATESVTAPTLIVNPPSAAAGFESQRMVYVRASHAREYFAHTEWVDTPARMLAPLIVAAVEANGGFRAVVRTPSIAAGDIRLDTEIVRLDQDFAQTPSRVHFTLRANLVDDVSRAVIATREFDVSVEASSDDPRAGVVAANRAVHDALAELAALCTEAAARWTRPSKG